jgi:hypothetical protein
MIVYANAAADNSKCTERRILTVMTTLKPPPAHRIAHTAEPTAVRSENTHVPQLANIPHATYTYPATLPTPRGRA